MSILGTILSFIFFQVWSGYQVFIQRLFLKEKVSQEEALNKSNKKKMLKEK